MSQPPAITRELLRALLRFAMARGVPAADGEDLVATAWEKASRAYDPSRGAFEALIYRVLENDVRYWWRQQTRVIPGNALCFPTADAAERAAAEARAERNQSALLERLSDDERAVFAAWALQKHLPKGQFDARAAARSLGLDVRAFNNAKRRLQARLPAILREMDLEPRDLYSVSDHEGPRTTRRLG